MAAIIIPRKHLSQPHGRVEIDPQWLTPDALIYCRSAGEFPNATTGFVQQHPSTEPRFLPEGVRLVADQGGANDDRFAFLGTFETARVAPLTSVLVASSHVSPYERTDVTDRMGHSIGFIDNNLRIGYRGGNGYDFFFKNADGVTYDIAAQSNNTFVFVVSTDPVNKQISVAASKNGVRVPLENLSGTANYIGKGSLSSETTNPFIGSSTYTNYYNFNGLLRMWDMDYTFIDQAKADEIAANPWQLFRADPIRIYSLPTGASSLSINSILASNITQTGARITLGLTR